MRSDFISGPRRRRAPVFNFAALRAAPAHGGADGLGLLRALGLLRHLLAKRLIPERGGLARVVARRGPDQGDGHRFNGEGVRPRFCKSPLPRDAIMGYENRAPDLRAWSLAVAGDEDAGYATEDDELRRRGCSRGRRRGPLRTQVMNARLSDAVHKSTRRRLAARLPKHNAIDVTPARWRGGVHPTRCLVCAQEMPAPSSAPSGTWRRPTRRAVRQG